MMTTTEIANKLVSLCKQGKDHEAHALYAADAVSVEAGGPPGMDRVSRGLDAIKGKGQWWYDNHVVHSVVVAGPWPHDDRFIVGFKMDITVKATAERSTMEEMALYTVKDGKIVREEFFYNTGG
jgi:SnoaL-like domain